LEEVLNLRLDFTALHIVQSILQEFHENRQKYISHLQGKSQEMILHAEYILSDRKCKTEVLKQRSENLVGLIDAGHFTRTRTYFDLVQF